MFRRWSLKHAVLLQYFVKSCQYSYLKQNILTLSRELDALWDFNLLDLEMSYVISFR